MRGQHFADFVNGFRQSVAEFFILKMSTHSIHDVLPEIFATFLVNRCIADNGKFVRSRRYEDQHTIALAGLVHSQSLKLFLCNDQRIGVEFTALDIDANLAGSFRFSIPNHFHDPVMFKLAEKLSGSHFTS